MRPPAAGPGGSPGVSGYYSSTSSAGTWPPPATPLTPSWGVGLAVAEAERLAGRSLAEQLTDPATGRLRRIKLVTDTGGAFKKRPVRGVHRLPTRADPHPHPPPLTRPKTASGSAFGSLKYEHLYRIEVPDGQTLAVEAEAYRQVFNTIRPHEALGMRRPVEVHQQDQQEQLPTEQN
jgi:putative transposase